MDRMQLEPGWPVRDTSDPRSPGDPTRPEGAPDTLIDTRLLMDWLGFAARAMWRHRILTSATWLLAFGAVWILAAGWPRTYQSYGRLLVQRNDVMSSLVNPGRTIPREDSAPTWAAQEIVRSRQNLLAIMKDTNLLEDWERTRTPLLRIKDWMVSWIGPPRTEAVRVEALAGLLEERIEVATDAEGIVSFTVRWPNAAMARQLVDQAMRKFLEYRRVSETSAIADSIAILDRSVEDLEAQVNRTIAELRRRGTRAPTPTRQPARGADPALARAAGALPSGPSAESTVRLARLKSALELRQQEIIRLDAARAQQLAEAQARLSAAQTIYTEGHPTVLALRQAMAQLSRESPELAAARRDAQNLEAEYDALSTRVSVETENAEQARARLSQLAAATPASTPAPPVDVPSLVNGGDPSEPVSLRLKVEMAQLAAVRERANAARAELSSSEVGFKYQYSILRPAQLPRAPVSPNVPAILLAGAMASLLLAIAVAVGMDLAGGLVLEAWQVERQVGVPVSLRITRV